MTKAKNKTTNKLNQVRIIGGQFKRRLIEFIDLDGLRPTPDRLRETLFNWLMADIHDAYVLDVCAGSGVLGFEAVSRGARHTTFIELNPQQYKQLQSTADTLQISANRASFYCGDAQAIIPTLSLDNPVNIVFIDPPYQLNLWQALLTSLISNNCIDTNSLIYIEADRPLESIVQAMSIDDNNYQFDIIKEKKVGQIYAGLITLVDMV